MRRMGHGILFGKATATYALALIAMVPTLARGQDADTLTSQPTAKDLAASHDPHRLAPTISGAELVARVRAAQAKGFAFLIESQNADGTWGSHDPQIARLSDFGFKLRNRGSQDGVRLACTAICATALLHRQDRSEPEEAALQRAINALVSPDKFAYHRNESFNIWGYGYKLDFLTRFLQTPTGTARRAEIVVAADVCIRGLLRYQQADGGWNYYAQPTMGGRSMSFTTANFIIALTRAKKLGLDVPAGLTEDAVQILRKLRTKKGGFMYDARFINSPRVVNELSAGGRTAVAALALHDNGVFKEADLVRSLEIFDESENYLEDGRKLIVPHTAVHQVSGYFFFYGYNYAAELATRLGARVARPRWDRFAWTMVRTQEPNGSWWDTAAAGYGDKWGTGFALQVMRRYLHYCESMSSIGEVR